LLKALVCLHICHDQSLIFSNDAGPLLTAFTDSIKYLRTATTDSEVISDWRSFDEKISMHISDLDGTAKHLNEINNLSNASRVRIQKNLALRHQAAIEPEEPAKFPIRMLPYKQNPKFYGREAELEKINNALDWKIKGNDPLRTYTIYGRRGVGKTQLALQYAYKNPANFEAIFWVRCETGLYLRQSFTDMANVINLPGANKHGHHEENQLAVMQWLKKTSKTLDIVGVMR
jgi:hypothetical protein